MSKSILIVQSPGHCGLPGTGLPDNEAKRGAADTQPDNEAKQGAADTQPDNTLDAVTRRALIRCSCHPPPTQHEQLREVYTSLLDEQSYASFPKRERTDLACFPSGHHPVLRHWQYLVGASKVADRRFCGEDVESAEYIWQRCPALLVERHHSNLGHTMDELVRLPRAAQTLLRIILRRLR